MAIKTSGNGVLGAVLIGAGVGLAIVGAAMVIPACTGWCVDAFDETIRRGRETINSGMETAASLAGNLSGTAQRKFSEASKTARDRAAKAAGAVESAARHVREYAQTEVS
ncbi:MAG TPA: hypothetical protein VH302_06595 [Bryobacteraceae bacterium]|jgi:hypothetical protein|nr:hypothetical protein [Bryobacteraceae bacterium]